MTMNVDTSHSAASSRRSRRQFLKRASAASTAVASTAWLGGFPTIVPRGVLAAPGQPGANDRVAVGAIGVGGRGRLLLQQLPESARLVALSDCNSSRAETFKAEAKGSWPIESDYRSLLERNDIDAVVVATGEFQRVLPCIHACQAGKDIYAEKPLTLYVSEGRSLVTAVRRHERILQVGTQQRSMEINRLACEFVRSGGLGKLRQVRAMNYPMAEVSPQQPFPAEGVPSGWNWDAWLNQAAWREFNREWTGWMRWRDFAGGEMTNWGAHGVDQIQWALGADHTGPVELWPIDSGTPGQVVARYDTGVEVHFVLEMGRGPMGGAVFVGEHGKLEINRNKVTSNPPEIAQEILKALDVPEEERKWSDSLALWQARWHMQNWIDCIRSRQQPVADVEIGHRSITVCHLVNITRQLGRRLAWDAAAEQFRGDDQANALLHRERRSGFELPA
ncbi:MAG: Gfo/Idh/MocA family oxidoreductase [Pirellulaceae bacterium]|nr:Gfo/Idh/MocA family oxidoreductase [Planctomycetales bacterium]